MVAASVCARTSCLMVSCITLSQSLMMLSVSYCIRYSQPWRVFSCKHKHAMRAVNVKPDCNHGNTPVPLRRSSWTTCPWRPSPPRLLSARRCILEQSVTIYSEEQEVIIITIRHFPDWQVCTDSNLITFYFIILYCYMFLTCLMPL